MTGMVNQVIDFHNHASWNVPVLLGEFNMFQAGSNPTNVWKFGIQLLNTNGMNWCNWAYKATHGTIPDSWGIYDYVGSAPTKPNIQNDSSTVISNDWAQVDTASRFVINPMLQASLAGPLAVSDFYTATNGTTLSVNSGSGVLANDTDINLGQPGIQLTASLVDGPSHGLLTLNTNGSFSYTPTPGFTGIDMFRYRVNDGYADSVNIGTVAIQVNPSSPPALSFEQWQLFYFGCTNCPEAQADADPYGKGMSNTNQFLVGFNPTNQNAYLRIINIARSAAGGVNIKVTYLGADGDSSVGIGARTNVLEYTAGSGSSGSYLNNFVSTGKTNILSGGNGSGFITNMVDVGGATNTPARYYRIRLVQ